MRRLLVTALVTGLGAFALIACGRREDTGQPEAAPLPSASVSAAPTGSESHAPFGRPPAVEAFKHRPDPCRIVSLSGVVKVDEHGAAPAPLAEGETIPLARWIALGPAAKLTVKDPRTTRETSFEGPGRVRACVANEEESWVAAGVFRSVPGAGESPGAEEWVMTPLGVVRYGAADVRVTVARDEVLVDVIRGAAFLWVDDAAKVSPASGAVDDEGWRRLEGTARDAVEAAQRKGPVTKLTPKVPLPKTLAARLEAGSAIVDRCAKAAHEAQALAQKLQEPGAAIADLAPKHVVARRLARASCGVARAWLESLPMSAAREELLVRARNADHTWRTLTSR